MDNFTLSIDTTNSAFGEGPNEPFAEIARILRELADRLEGTSEASGWVRDGNGNKVGRFNCTETVGDPAPHRKSARN